MPITPRSTACAAALTAAMVVGLAAPASADTHLHFRLDPLTFTPVVWGQGTTSSDPNCHYRVRYGNFGNVAFAQIRMYAGGCGGYNVQVHAWQGSTYRAFSAGGPATTGGDGCGSYFELQATSPANWIAVRGVAVSGRPSPNKYFYHFHAAGQGNGGPIPASRIVRHCDGS